MDKRIISRRTAVSKRSLEPDLDRDPAGYLSDLAAVSRDAQYAKDDRVRDLARAVLERAQVGLDREQARA